MKEFRIGVEKDVTLLVGKRLNQPLGAAFVVTYLH